MTNPMDLAKTLEGLSEAADKEADDIRYYSGGSDYNASLAKFHNALVEAYRTGQLIVVDHPQATSPVDDRGGAVCEQQDVEAVARAIYGEDDFVGLGDDITQRMFAVARKAIAAMPSLAAKDAEIARLREALDAIRASATGVTFNLADLALASAKPMKEAP